VESGEQNLVGVNVFRADQERPVPILRIDAAAEAARREHLQRFRQARPRQSVRDALKRLEDAAVSSANLVPAVIGAVEGQATLGEIADTLRRVYGVYQENVVC
jgi:methylmalonyl-CoA mutase N-terminal domain/subunit